VDPSLAKWIKVMGAKMRVGNRVEALVDGPETFGSMLNAIRTASAPGHYIYLLGWWLDLDVPLDPSAVAAYCSMQSQGAAPGDPSSLRQLLSKAAASGVQIRVMLYNYTGTQNTPECEFVNTLPTGAAVLDDNWLHDLYGSQHQKILIINGSGGLTAFCGGVDINPDRVCPKAPSSGSSGASGQGSPLHDVHCRIAGPAADDLLQIFVKRWYANPKLRALDQAKGPLLGLCQPPSLPSGSSGIRIGETFNGVAALPVRPVTDCSLPPPEQPAQQFRDRDVQEIFLTAIECARQFIYWEDQYMVNMCAAEALRNTLPNVSLIILLIADSPISDLPHRWYRRRLFIDHIRNHPQGSKLHVFTLFDPATGGPIGKHTYVHAKTMIVDDELAIIGSANCNRRGWESDTEVAAAIAGGMDDAGLNFASRLRRRLWAEHLGVASTAVEDAPASAPLWWLAASGPSQTVTLPSGITVPLPARRVRPYNTAGGTDPLLPDSLESWDFVDPGAPKPGSPCSKIWAETAAAIPPGAPAASVPHG
jgi:phosphatidylserine/phosphatidylglycerophosphate/cardiolipin synthase-like enzyme